MLFLSFSLPFYGTAGIIPFPQSLGASMRDKAAVFIDGGYLSNVMKHHFTSTKIDYQIFQTFSAGIMKESGPTFIIVCLINHGPPLRTSGNAMFPWRNSSQN